jgi:transposase
MGEQRVHGRFAPRFKSTVGVDVHSKTNFACYYRLEEGDDYTCEHKEFSTLPEGNLELANWVIEKKAEAVIMESTGVYWKSLRKALVKAGITVVVVNPRHVKVLPGRKTDVSDSEWLGQVGCLGILRPSFVNPPELDHARHLSRLNQKITQDLARSRNRVVKCLVEHGLRLDLVVSDVFGKSARAVLEAIVDGETPTEAIKRVSTRLKAGPDEIRKALADEPGDKGRAELRRFLEHVVWHEKEKARIEDELLEELRPHSEILDRLETIPGISRHSAAAVLAEMGPDMTVFGTADRLSRWAGVCPGNNESAGKRKSGRTVPGNRWIQRTLCECAHAAARTTSHFSHMFRGIRARRVYKRALVAVAHRLLRTMFYLITRNDIYRDRVVDCAALALRKTLPRWAAALKRLGQLPPDPRSVPAEEPKRRPGRRRPPTGLSQAEEVPSAA